MELYKEKNIEYFSGVRNDLIGLIPKDGRKILEIGAGGGNTLVYLKRNGLADFVAGVELFTIEDGFQKSPEIDRFILANIEDKSLDLTEGSFDVILCGDVLEHLINPWETVEYLSKYLRKDGYFIASVPNIQDILSMIKIFILGDFRYSIDGVLDKSHFRFFCKKNIIDLLTNSDLKVEFCTPSFNRAPAQYKRRLLNKLTFGLFEGYCAVQYLVISRKK